MAGMHVISGHRVGRAHGVRGTVRVADISRTPIPWSRAESRHRVPHLCPTRLRPKDVRPADYQRRPAGVQRSCIRLLRTVVQVSNV